MCKLGTLLRKRLTLPHPEELPDYRQTLENVSIAETVAKWFKNWAVPQAYWDFWQNKIAIEVTESIMTPAQTWEKDGIRHLDVRPEWLNPGVIAHEQAHNSYALLTDEQRVQFSEVYTPLKTADKLIKLLYSINPYGLTNDVEGHAEVYRYLAEKMPEVLKQFYRRLL